jgi:ABC-type Fe3+/spermidine/putrescine transport system ATPase subunit
MTTITVDRLTKRFGATTAVDELSFTVEPGRVTGFLGPNGAGKTTTLQLMLGLVNGGGRALFDGRPYRDLPDPMRAVGAVLDARAFHPRRSARDHLLMLAAALAVGVSAITRGAGLAVVLLGLWAGLLEPLAAGVLGGGVAGALPFLSMLQLTHPAGDALGLAPAGPASAAVFPLCLAATLAAAGVALARRDATLF